MDAAKAHVPGCELWGKSVYPESGFETYPVGAIDVPLDQQPHLDELIQGICRGDMVSCIIPVRHSGILVSEVTTVQCIDELQP